MPLKFLNNTVFEASALPLDRAASDIVVSAITGGPRHTAWVTSTTAARRVGYLSHADNLSADTVVICRADRLAGQTIKINSWTSGGEDGSPIRASSAFNDTLVGASGQDYVLEFAQRTAKREFSVQFPNSVAAATLMLSKLYFCNAFAFANGDVQSVQITPLGKSDCRVIKHCPYQIQDRLIVNQVAITDADIQSFEAAFRFREQAFFVYDSTGLWIADKLAHVILAASPVVKVFHDVYQMRLELLRLRSY